VRATMGGVLIAVTLLTSVSNAQRSAPPPQTGSAVELPPVELHPLAHSSEATPTTPQLPSPHCQHRPRRIPPRCYPPLSKPRRRPARWRTFNDYTLAPVSWRADAREPWGVIGSAKLARAFDTISRCSMNLVSTAATKLSLFSRGDVLTNIPQPPVSQDSLN
jgi:hypothetical protein